MKTYFRLLAFAKPIEKYAIPYIIFTLLYVVFITMVLIMLGPLLNTLFNFNIGPIQPHVSKPGSLDLTGWCTYYLRYFVHRYGQWPTLKIVCVSIVVGIILADICRYMSARIMENLRIHTLYNLRKTVFNNVMDMHMGFFNNERKGDIVSKVASDVQVVQFSVTSTLQVIFKEPMTMVGYLIGLFAISVKLTLFSLLVIPVSVFIIARIVKKLRGQATIAQQSYGTMISYLDEALSGVKIIKAFNATNFIKDRFNFENRRYSKILRSMAKRQQSASPVSEILSVTMISFILLYGGYLIIVSHSKELDPGFFLSYIGIFSQLNRPAKAISDSFSNINQGIAAGERVLALIDEKPAIKDKKDAIVINEFNDGIYFKNVSFRYEEKPILRNLNFIVPKGKTVALVGPSGGGKSTLMDLIPRFIEPQSGEVCIDSHNVQDVTMDSLRSLMGIVNQETILFNDSIFNNIAFGKTGVTQEQVEAAARIANAHNFILETEEGYNTNIGYRGTKLSGGQRQRICIARAVLNNPPIMLLDEATSALDTESEKLVQEALNNLMKNRTSLIIAHRLSTIQNADIIIVLENGEIVEQGQHHELMNQNGLYRRLIDMQTFQ
jgi:subfamily B ATP-binding cassette protein MsbA